jgi:hypothetical protein
LALGAAAQATRKKLQPFPAPVRVLMLGFGTSQATRTYQGGGANAGADPPALASHCGGGLILRHRAIGADGPFSRACCLRGASSRGGRAAALCRCLRPHRAPPPRCRRRPVYPRRRRAYRCCWRRCILGRRWRWLMGARAPALRQQRGEPGAPGAAPWLLRSTSSCSSSQRGELALWGGPPCDCLGACNHHQALCGSCPGCVVLCPSCTCDKERGMGGWVDRGHVPFLPCILDIGGWAGAPAARATTFRYAPVGTATQPSSLLT